MQCTAMGCQIDKNLKYEKKIYIHIRILYYLSDPHRLLMKSKSLIVGPHLSGLESLGQTVTVGKGNSSMG